MWKAPRKTVVLWTAALMAPLDFEPKKLESGQNPPEPALRKL